MVEGKKYCPRCKKNGVSMTDCGFGVLGETGYFPEGDSWGARMECSECGVQFTVNNGLLAMSKAPLVKTFDELLIDTDAGDPAARALAFKEKCPQCGRTPPVGFSWNEETKKVDLRCSEGHEWPTEHLDRTIFDVPHPSDPDFKCSKCGRNAWGSHICEG